MCLEVHGDRGRDAEEDSRNASELLDYSLLEQAPETEGAFSRLLPTTSVPVSAQYIMTAT
jgi:hypothetical protein